MEGKAKSWVGKPRTFPSAEEFINAAPTNVKMANKYSVVINDIKEFSNN